MDARILCKVPPRRKDGELKGSGSLPLEHDSSQSFASPRAKIDAT